MNVLTQQKRNTVETLRANGVSQHEIHRKTGIDRKTIRKIARGMVVVPANSSMATGSGESGTQISPPRPPASTAGASPVVRSACEPHRAWIEAQIRLGRNAIAIYQDLVDRHDFASRYNSVKRFCRSLRQAEPAQFDRLEFLPGEEAQVDYGEGALTLSPNGRYRRPRLFVMTLRHSRRSFRKVVWNSSSETWARLHEEAFRYFGGVVQYVVLDNLKEGVIKPDIFEPELNRVYAEMLKHYGVVADAARVRDPNRKGTVESAIQHTQATALKGRRFDSIAAQNEFLDHWETNWAAKRIHGRAKRQVEDMFQEERAPLFSRLLRLLLAGCTQWRTRRIADIEKLGLRRLSAYRRASLLTHSAINGPTIRLSKLPWNVRSQHKFVSGLCNLMTVDQLKAAISFPGQIGDPGMMQGKVRTADMTCTMTDMAPSFMRFR